MTNEVQIQTQAQSSATRERTETAYRPAVDIIERADALIVIADVPGADEGGIGVSIENDVLTISAQVTVAEFAAHEALYRGYAAHDFRRDFTLVKDIEREKITASLKAGVLRITLPKAARAQPFKIKVNTEK